MATDVADLAQAALDAALLNDITALPEGFETRITDGQQNQLPRGFRQRLILARAFVRHAPIYLLDEAANNLDPEGDTALMRKLQSLKGRSTVILVTHSPGITQHCATPVALVAAGRVQAGPRWQVLTTAALREAFGGEFSS